MAVGQTIAALPCGQLFHHRVCLLPWLERAWTCPTCRGTVSDAAVQQHCRQLELAGFRGAAATTVGPSDANAAVKASPHAARCTAAACGVAAREGLGGAAGRQGADASCIESSVCKNLHSKCMHRARKSQQKGSIKRAPTFADKPRLKNTTRTSAAAAATIVRRCCRRRHHIDTFSTLLYSTSTRRDSVKARLPYSVTIYTAVYML